MAKQPARLVIATNANDVKKLSKTLEGVITNTRKASKEAEKQGKTFDGLRKQINSLQKAYSQVHGGMSKLFGAVGIGFGLKSLISQAWELNRHMVSMHNALTRISDASGDTSAALSMQFRVAGKSLASLGKVAAAMNALGEAGVQTGPAMEELATWVSDMAQASGIGAEKLASLTGELKAYWKTSEAGAVEVAAAAINTQKVFGTTTSQIELMIGTIQKAQNNIGALSRDGEKGIKALARGISMAAGVLNKFGVNAQVATDFLDRMLDPERFAESNTLLRMMGISIEEQLKMMESAAGKELFFDKMMKNLPALSQKIQSISNPLMRLQYAKNLGLPPEIAAKLASAQAGQIGKIMADYKKQQAADKQAEEKRRKAQADEQKFSDMMLGFKLQVLGPMMQWVMKAFGELSKPGGVLPRLLNTLRNVVQFVVSGLELVTPFLFKMAEGLLANDPRKFLEGAEGFADVVIPKIVTFIDTKLIPLVGKILTKWGPKLLSSLLSLGTALMKGLFSALWNMPWQAKMMLVTGGLIKGAFALNRTLAMFKLVTGRGPGGIFQFAGGIPQAFRNARHINQAMSAGMELPGMGRGSRILASIMRGGGSVLSKAFLPLAAIAGGVMGGMDAEKHYGKKNVTGGERAASTVTGAATLGILPLIDKIFDTNLTGPISKALLKASKSSLAFISPLTTIIRLFDSFSNKPVDDAIVDKYEALQKKEYLLKLENKSLSADEIMQQRKLGKTMADAHTSFAEGVQKFFGMDLQSNLMNMYNLTEQEAEILTYAVKQGEKQGKIELNNIMQRRKIAKEELLFYREKLALGGKLTDDEAKRYFVLKKNAEASRGIFDGILDWVARIAGKWESLFVSIDYWIARNLSKPMVDFFITAKQWWDSWAFSIGSLKERTATTKSGWQDILANDALSSERRKYVKEMIDLYKESEEMGNLSGTQADVVSKGLWSGKLVDVLAAIAAVKAGGVVGPEITQLARLEQLREIAARTEGENAEKLLAQNEQQHNDNKQLWGGIGRDLNSIKNTVVKAEPPSRQDLIAAMIGTYGNTQWTFSV